ncbi:MAG TPA: nucleotidyltransferase family protein, partial [bacterium]|nr:nucleotidyltransferase family protein [bacterium]
MEPRIPIDMDSIKTFCEKWKVKEFYLFGSVLRDDFSPTSDVDVCVRFDESAPWDLFHIVDMMEELKQIFGRKVDLLEADAIRNPYRRKEIMGTRRLI